MFCPRESVGWIWYDKPHYLTPNDKVVTTGFANLSDGSQVAIGTNDNTPTQDLAPRKREQKGGQGSGRRSR